MIVWRICVYHVPMDKIRSCVLYSNFSNTWSMDGEVNCNFFETLGPEAGEWIWILKHTQYWVNSIQYWTLNWNHIMLLLCKNRILIRRDSDRTTSDAIWYQLISGDHITDAQWASKGPVLNGDCDALPLQERGGYSIFDIWIDQNRFWYFSMGMVLHGCLPTMPTMVLELQLSGLTYLSSCIIYMHLLSRLAPSRNNDNPNTWGSGVILSVMVMRRYQMLLMRRAR